MNSPIMTPREYEENKRRKRDSKKQKLEDFFYITLFVIFVVFAILAVLAAFFHLDEEKDYRDFVEEAIINSPPEELSRHLNDKKFIETLSNFSKSRLNKISNTELTKLLIEITNNGSYSDLSALTLSKIGVPVSTEVLISGLGRSSNNIAEQLRSSGDERAVLPLLATGHDIGSLPNPRISISRLCDDAKDGKLKKVFRDESSMYIKTPLWKWQTNDNMLSPSEKVDISPLMTIQSVSCIYESHEKVWSYGSERPVYGDSATGIKGVQYTWSILVVEVPDKVITAENVIHGPVPPKITSVNKFDMPDKIGDRPFAKYSTWTNKLLVGKP